MTFSCFFFFNDTATTEIYTLSLHDALPISVLTFDSDDAEEQAEGLTVALRSRIAHSQGWSLVETSQSLGMLAADRKSTRLNSSHANISYAVFCLKKKKIHINLILLHLKH